jgi:hypothetical protein
MTFINCVGTDTLPGRRMFIYLTKMSDPRVNHYSLMALGLMECTGMRDKLLSVPKCKYLYFIECAKKIESHRMFNEEVQKLLHSDSWTLHCLLSHWKEKIPPTEEEQQNHSISNNLIFVILSVRL